MLKTGEIKMNRTKYLPYKANNLSRERDEKTMYAFSLFTQTHIYSDIRISANCVTEVGTFEI